MIGGKDYENDKKDKG